MNKNSNTSNMQDRIVEAVDIVVKKRVEGANYTKQYEAIVKKIEPFKAVVLFNDSLIDVILPEHLYSWIDVDDIVTVLQDNNMDSIIGKTSTIRQDNIVIEKDGILVSGVESLENNDEISYYNIQIEKEE